MPKNSPPGKRSFGLDNGAGKGDKSRVTDEKTYRENFDEIFWGYRLPFRPEEKTIPPFISADEL